MGWPSAAADRSASQIQTLDRVIQSGYRRFLAAYDWSFLRPSTTLAVSSGDYDYDLPDNIANVEGHFTFATSDNQYGPIPIVGEGQIRALREAQSSTTGVPQLAAIRPKTATTTASEGQRFEVIFWPTPNGTYTLGYRYNELVAKISTSLPYPLGGLYHGETILASCQQKAEEEIDDIVNGQYQKKYDELIQHSIRLEQKMYGPEFFGYNGDRESEPPQRRAVRGLTFNGTLYS